MAPSLCGVRCCLFLLWILGAVASATLHCPRPTTHDPDLAGDCSRGWLIRKGHGGFTYLPAILKRRGLAQGDMLGNNQPTQCPRAALHVKTRQSDPFDQALNGGVGLPASHGRRLMQMIFRSNNDSEAKEPVQESVVLASPVAFHGDSRTEDDVMIPVGSTKLSALKRKLFPTRKRRHPARIPPLVVSPIHAALEDTDVVGGGNNRCAGDQDEPKRTEELSWEEREDEAAFLPKDTDHDIDDDLLRAIEVADRLQSAASDEILAQMSHAVDDLFQWKAEQKRTTQTALKTMEEKVEQEAAASAATGHDDASDMALLDEADRNQRVAEATRTKLLLTLKETEASMAARRKGDMRVAQALLDAEREAGNTEPSEVGAPTATLLRLREQVFDLGVKELSSKLQASWLQELGGADDELDMKLYDMQTYASDLDSVLAQFEATSTGSECDAEQTTAGQGAQEH